MDDPSHSISTDTQGPYEVEDIELPYYLTEIDIRNNTICRPLRRDFSENIDSTLMMSNQADGEDVAAEFYRRQGFEIVNVSKGTNFDKLVKQEDIPEELRNKLEDCLLNDYDRTYIDDINEKDSFFDAFDRPLSFIENSGIPDLLVFRVAAEDPMEFFFSEVKLNGDSLRRTQLEWLFEFDCFPARIIYVDENSPHEPLM